jgi:predicted MPP superfamily phosphohydrolase
VTNLFRGFWARVLGNLFLTLGLTLGALQAVVAVWAATVLFGTNGPGLWLGLALAALLVFANYRLLPVLRRARHIEGWPRRAARLYMSAGLATLLLGFAVLLSYAGFLPIHGLLSLLGVDPATSFALFRFGSGALVLGTLGFLLWGFTAGQALVERTHVRVALPGLPDDLRGLRIVQISDLHIGNGLEGARLDRVVARVNAHDPDVVALTGDLFDFDPRYVEDGARRLNGLTARHGVFAVLGNHDGYTGLELVADALARLAPGVTVLRGDVVRLPTGSPLYVAGIDDPGTRFTARDLHIPELEELAALRPADGHSILLVHRPEAFAQAARLGFPLVLAGHTHGGQLALPTRGGRHNLASLVTRYTRGLFAENGSFLYVNRGIGVAGPAIRLNCSREIATIELV